jgi:uncharacterized protein YfkK (UPF0435 family)
MATPTNEQIAEHLQIIGERLINMDTTLISQIEANAQIIKLVASRISEFSPEEDAVLRKLAQHLVNDTDSLKRDHKDFVDLVAKFSQL